MRMTAEDSLVAFDEEGVRVVFKLKKGESETDTIIKAVISNSNPQDLEEFTLQVAVPKVGLAMHSHVVHEGAGEAHLRPHHPRQQRRRLHPAHPHPQQCTR